MDLMILPLIPKGGSPLPGTMLWSRPSQHPVSQAALDRFAEGSANVTERRAVLKHLLSGCQECSRSLARQWQGVPAEESDYDDAIEQSFERALAAFATRAH